MHSLRFFSAIMIAILFAASCGRGKDPLSSNSEESTEEKVTSAGKRISSTMTVSANRVGGSCERCGRPISTPTVTSNTLSVASGQITVSENVSLADASESSPSGVIGQTDVLIGSFVITAGIGEGVDIREICMTDDVGVLSGQSLSTVFQNLRLESGGPADSNGNYAARTQIGATKGSLTNTANTYYHFFPSPAIKLNAGAQMVVNVYADIIGTAYISIVNSDDDGIIYPSTVGAYGTDTGNVANGTMSRGLQNVYIAEYGDMAFSFIPQTGNRVIPGGASTMNVGTSFRITAELGEDLALQQLTLAIMVEDSSGNTVHPDGISNFRLRINGSILQGTVPITSDALGMFIRDDISGLIGFVFQPNEEIIIPEGVAVMFEVLFDASVLDEDGHLRPGSSVSFALLVDHSVSPAIQPSIVARGVTSSAQIDNSFNAVSAPIFAHHILSE